MRRLRLSLAAVGVALLAAVFAAAATADDDDDGFRTGAASMLTCATCDRNLPILTVGEPIPGTGYRFEAIPDGIAIFERGGDEDDDDDDSDDDRRSGASDDDDGDGGRFELLVNHETSRVPFPFNPPFGGVPTPPAVNESNQNDFDNSQVSRIALNGNTEFVRGRMSITSSQNFHRFCSSYLATKREGFGRPIYFANEEAQDWVFRSGNTWPGPSFIPPGTPGAEQTGVVAAYDVRRDTTRTIYGMGRLNHENTVAIPGFKDLVVLTTDDTFFTTPVAAPYKPAWSQLYTYIADDTRDLLNDRGDLWAFVSDDPAVDDYFDFAPNSAISVSGRFIKVPKHIAVGKHPAGSPKAGQELLSTDFTSPDMLEPPTGVSGPPPNGPQWVLDQWGNAENNVADGVAPSQGVNVFRFVRLEDVAYDKRRGMENVIYLVDSGRGSVPGTTPFGSSTNGRVWKMVLDKKDPTKVTSLSILIEGDDNPVKTLGEIHQPDNMESTRNSLLIQEDPGSSQQFPFGSTDPNATTARIWRYDLGTGALTVVASINQAADEGPTDVDGPQTTPPTIAKANLGSWESSGVVDASSVLGRGWFFVTIQAHTLWVQKQDGPDAIGPPPDANIGKDFTFKREGGQLIAIRIPGA